MKKCARKVVVASLIQKQLQPQLNVKEVHAALAKTVFKNSERAQAEFHIVTALEEATEKNSLKRVFSVMFLQNQAQTKFAIEHQMMVSIVTMLLNDPDTHVRRAALNLAEAYANLSPSAEVQAVFEQTDKPKSVKKPLDRKGLTPLKPSTAVLFLNELLQTRSEIEQDQSQLTTALNKTKHPELVEVMLRNVLDLPSYELKSKQIQALSLVEKHTMAFAISLADVLRRLFSLRQVL